MVAEEETISAKKQRRKCKAKKIDNSIQIFQNNDQFIPALSCCCRAV